MLSLLNVRAAANARFSIGGFVLTTIIADCSNDSFLSSSTKFYVQWVLVRIKFGRKGSVAPTTNYYIKTVCAILMFYGSWRVDSLIWKFWRLFVFDSIKFETPGLAKPFVVCCLACSMTFNSDILCECFMRWFKMNTLPS